MNRPFYAIGVLLAFLGIAMLAVGVSSRPRHTHRRAGGVSALPRLDGDQLGDSVSSPSATSGRGGVYVVVLPAANEIVNESPAFELGCGLDRTTGVRYPQPLVVEQVEAEQPALESVTFVPVTICEAAEPTLPMALEEVDCLAHYDATYDAEVYGVQGDTLVGESTPEEVAPITRFEVGDAPSEADCLELIHGLMGEGLEVGSQQTSCSKLRQTVAGSHERPSSWTQLGWDTAQQLQQIAVAALDPAAELLMRLVAVLVPEAWMELARTAPVSSGNESP